MISYIIAKQPLVGLQALRRAARWPDLVADRKKARGRFRVRIALKHRPDAFCPDSRPRPVRQPPFDIVEGHAHTCEA